MIANSSAVMPVTLLGSLAILVRADLGFSETQLGLAVSVFFACAAGLSVHGGRFAERLSPARSMSLGVFGSCLALLGIATLAWSFEVLLVFLIIAGLANAVGLPGANLTLARAVPAHQRGLAFGLKQASVPMATTVAGFAVPVLGLTIGWRWAFALMSLALVPFLLALRSVPPVEVPPRGARPRPDVRNSALVVLAVGAAFAVAVGSSLGTFYVESAVAQGIRPDIAGIMLAAGGISGVLGRITWGVIADRRGRGALRLAATLLGLGSLGLLGLAFVGGLVALAVSTLLAFAFGWGWNGLFHYAVVRHNPSAPAAASGITMMGMRSGGVAGPFLFGFTVERLGYPVAWGLSAVSLLVGASLFLIGRGMIVRGRRDLTGASS